MVKMTGVGGMEVPRDHGELRRSEEGRWPQRVGRIQRWRGVDGGLAAYGKIWR